MSTADAPDLRDRYRGALLGLAVGDALGTTIEFRLPGSFELISEIVGGGPFELEPGQWTDDTSMALYLAESLIDCRGFDPRDQMEPYPRWWKEGHLSSTGRLGVVTGIAPESEGSRSAPTSTPSALDHCRLVQRTRYLP
jgi:ADP-ribosylglycohydrolase